MTTTKFSKYMMMLILSIAFTTVSTAMMAQSLKIIPGSSSMTIYGTTNVHDFTSKVTQISGELVISSSKQVQSLVVNIPVKSIKSGEKIMDKKTYETFNADKNSNIAFHLTHATTPNVSGQDIDVTLTGNLTMAGVTRKISFKTSGKYTKTGIYQFKGSVPLKMTDFNMKPPTAMLGVMKVGDGVILKFDIAVATQNMASID